MGDPCDEILRNHSKGSRRCFYALWADYCLSRRTALEPKSKSNVDLGDGECFGEQ